MGSGFEVLGGAAAGSVRQGMKTLAELLSLLELVNPGPHNRDALRPAVVPEYTGWTERVGGTPRSPDSDRNREAQKLAHRRRHRARLRGAPL